MDKQELLNEIKQRNTIKVRFDVNKLQQNFDKFAQFGQVYYPLKSGSDEVLLQELLPMINSGNHGFSIKIMAHYEKLKKLGVPVSRINLIDVQAEDSFVKFLYNEGVRNFTFDNMDSLKNFAKYADAKDCKIHVRLNISEVFKNILPNEEVTHLGGSLAETKAMCQVLNKLNCTDYGISFYIQKELKNTPSALKTMLDYIMKNYKDSGLNFINIGGSKTPEELTEIQPKLKEVQENLGVEYILLEPGRYLAGNTMDMVSRIFRTKQVQGKEVVILKNGLYSGLLDEKLYNKKFDYRLEDEEGNQTKIERQKTKEATHEFMLCGQSSDSGDRMGLCYVPETAAHLLKANTNVIVKDVGTYCLELQVPLGGDIQFEVIKSNPAVSQTEAATIEL